MPELVLYGIRLLAQASLGKLSTNESGPDCTECSTERSPGNLPLPAGVVLPLSLDNVLTFGVNFILSFAHCGMTFEVKFSKHAIFTVITDKSSGQG